MKKGIFTKIFIIAFVLFFTNLYSNSLYFLKDINVKNSGAGYCLIPFLNDAFTPFTNPAGLASLKKQELGFTYNNFFGFSSLSAGSFAYPIYEFGSFAISGAIFSTGDIEERNELNELTGNFTDTYKILNLSYGIKLFQFLNTGINFSYLNHNFYNFNLSAFGMDAGLIFDLPYNIKISTTLNNFVKPVFEYQSLNKDILPLEFNLVAGISFKIFNEIKDNLKISSGFVMEEFKNQLNIIAGLEYSVFDTFAVRCGMNKDDYSFGASVKLYDMSVDYAFIKLPFDYNHRFGLNISYGEDIRELEEKTKTKEAKIKQEFINKIKVETIAKFKADIDMYLNKGDLENAKITVEKALVWAPEDSEIIEKEKKVNFLLNEKKIKDLLDEADELLKQDLYIDAMVKLKAVLEIDPENKIALNKFNKAEEYVKALGEKNFMVEEKNKQMIKESFEKGLKYYSAQQYQKAIEEWDKVIKSSPLQRQVYNYIKSAQEKIQKKEEQKKTAEILKRDRIKDLYNKAVLEYTKGNFNESLNLWHELLKIDPENKEAKEYIDKIVEDYKKIQKQEIGW